MSEAASGLDFLYRGGLYEHNFLRERSFIRHQRATKVKYYNPLSPHIPSKRIQRRDAQRSSEWGTSIPAKLDLENFDNSGRYIIQGPTSTTKNLS